MYFTVTNTKILRKLSFSLKFSKPKSKNAEKQHFWHFSAFLDFGFENFKENGDFLTIFVLITVKCIKPQYINQFGAMFYSQLFQKLSCGR